MIRYLKPVGRREAKGLVARLYRQIEEEFILGEPLTLHSPIPGLLAGVWCSFRETFIAGHAPRSWKEAIAVAVSRSNRCPYCLDAHTMALQATAPVPGIRALRSGDTSALEDPVLRALFTWAVQASDSSGRIQDLPGLPNGVVPELAGSLVWMNYINRMVTLFIGKSLIPEPIARIGLRGLAEHTGSWYFRKRFTHQATPGASLELLPFQSAPFDPAGLAWGTGSEPILAAFNHLVSTVDNGAKQSVAAEAQAWFLQVSAGMPAIQEGLGLDWLSAALDQLDAGLHRLGRFLLLASRAPHRIQEEDLAIFRETQRSGESLLQAAAWASFTTARQIGDRAIRAFRP